MMWMAALALVALSSTSERVDQVSCALAPFVGGGSSSEGPLDSMNGLNFSCDMSLFYNERWAIGPQISLTEQTWTILRIEEQASTLNSFQARSLGIGLLGRYSLASDWQLSYGLSYGRGQGSQLENVSTPTSVRDLRYANVNQLSLKHSISASHSLSKRMSVVAGLHIDSGQQRWDASTGTFRFENVAPGNRLTLTSGKSTDLDQSLKQSSNYRAFNVSIGLSLLLSGS
jgi:hypothetical protein